MDSNNNNIDDIQFSGNELDEPENNKNFTGNELDESDNDEYINEKKPVKPDGVVKQNKYNDTSEAKDEPTSVENEQKLPWKKKITIVHKISVIAILVCLIAAVVYFTILRQSEVKHISTKIKQKSANIKDKSLALEPFIVPFKNNKYYTYILVEISFDVSENKLRFEMAEKQMQLRNIIYDILLNAIENAQSVPPVADIKNYIKSGINPVLETGKIKEVFVTNYHAM